MRRRRKEKLFRSRSSVVAEEREQPAAARDSTEVVAAAAGGGAVSIAAVETAADAPLQLLHVAEVGGSVDGIGATAAFEAFVAAAGSGEGTLVAKTTWRKWMPMKTQTRGWRIAAAHWCEVTLARSNRHLLLRLWPLL